MSNISELLESLIDIETKANKVGEPCKIVKLNKSLLVDKLRESGESVLGILKTYGIIESDVKFANDTGDVFYLKTESIDHVDTDKLTSELESAITNYYGVVQFDGTEPDAKGFYNSQYNDYNGINYPDGIGGRVDNSPKDDKSKSKNIKKVNKSSNITKKVVKKSSTSNESVKKVKKKSSKVVINTKPKDEATDAGNIPSNIGSTKLIKGNHTRRELINEN